MTKTGRVIIGVGIAIVIFVIMIILIFVAIRGKQSSEDITLEFWGTFDSRALFQEAFDGFKEINPRVTISYRQFPFEEYEDTLINAFASENGPDMFMMHNTWLPKHIDRISPLPAKPLPGTDKPLKNLKEFELEFVDVTRRDFIPVNGAIYALPLYVDTLAMYYNKDLFNAKGLVRPPATWEQFNEYVPILTELDDNNNIVQSAAAIGTARNINRSTDILMMLMLQTGVRMTDPENINATFASPVQGTSVGANALSFYTEFANSTNRDLYTWDDAEHFSIDAFAQGDTAMMFNYSHHIPTIRSRTARFNFDIAPVPQPADGRIDITYANYWAPTVAKQSQYSNTAWQFLNYLTSKEGSRSYIEKSGRPSARRDIIEEQSSDPDLGVFALQALSARSWYQIDNNAIETIFANMIDNVNFNVESVPDAVEKAERQVNVIMSRARR